MARTLVHNALIQGPKGKAQRGWLLTDGPIIAATGKGDHPSNIQADTEIDAEGDLLLPGLIDTHVHFREPGLTHKATIRTESEAAVSGGVTSFFDMPNVVPPTTSLDAWQQKMDIAARTSAANYAFYIGATNTNLDSTLLKADYTHVPGVKLFLGSSTGNLLVDSQAALERLFAEVKVPIAVHAESNRRIALLAAMAREAFGKEAIPIELHSWIRDTRACLDASQYAADLALKHGSRLHLLHISTAAELRMFKQLTTENITSETCVHYLQFADTDYAELGARIKCNPAIKSGTDRTALRKAVKDGTIDVIGSDHAPHLLSEKTGDALSAPSGMPGVQFQLPLLLDLYSPEVVARVGALRPAQIFHIDRRGALLPGNYADMVRVRSEDWTITDSAARSLCEWTPYSSLKTGHKIISTWVNGQQVFDGKTVTPGSAMPLKFNNNISL